jgi:hypothetical protein
MTCLGTIYEISSSTATESPILQHVPCGTFLWHPPWKTMFRVYNDVPYERYTRIYRTVKDYLNWSYTYMHYLTDRSSYVGSFTKVPLNPAACKFKNLVPEAIVHHYDWSEKSILESCHCSSVELSVLVTVFCRLVWKDGIIVRKYFNFLMYYTDKWYSFNESLTFSILDLAMQLGFFHQFIV